MGLRFSHQHRKVVSSPSLSGILKDMHTPPGPYYTVCYSHFRVVCFQFTWHQSKIFCQNENFIWIENWIEPIPGWLIRKWNFDSVSCKQTQRNIWNKLVPEWVILVSCKQPVKQFHSSVSQMVIFKINLSPLLLNSPVTRIPQGKGSRWGWEQGEKERVQKMCWSWLKQRTLAGWRTIFPGYVWVDTVSAVFLRPPHSGCHFPCLENTFWSMAIPDWD